MGISDYLYRTTDAEKGPTSSTSRGSAKPGSGHDSATKNVGVVDGPPEKSLTPIQEKDEAVDVTEERIETVVAPEESVHAIPEDSEARAEAGREAIADSKVKEKNCEVRLHIS